MTGSAVTVDGRPFTRIVATLGPATRDESVLLRMYQHGMDVVRLNFSHGDHDGHRYFIELIHKLNESIDPKIEILGDLEGPRIRVGSLGEPIPLAHRDRVRFHSAPGVAAGGRRLVPLDFQGSYSSLTAARQIFIDDGNITFDVEGVERDFVDAVVGAGGLLKAHKGVNIPDVWIDFPEISEKDRADIRFALEHGVDYLAQSFVRNRSEIERVAREVNSHSGRVKLIAKIENRDGVHNSGEILEVADGIMVARGDMGVTLPVWEVPMIQKELIRTCNRRKKLVITATQMLESMVNNGRPTRAEVTDVANAIIDGTDFVMLSAETAVGKHPVEAVHMMNRICGFTERSIRYVKLP